MKHLLSLLILLGSASAFANTNIQCGKTADAENGTVTKQEFTIVSENDILIGKSGTDWQIYNSQGAKISGTLSAGPKGSLVLIVPIARIAAGAAGIKYVIANANGDIVTTAEKFNVGGFAGGTKTGTFVCLVTAL